MLEFLPRDSVLINMITLLVCFWGLSKSANFLVDSAVGIAFQLRIPKVIIGIVLVSMGTTIPEFVVSFLAALKGHSAMALGNACGSVIVNSVGLALAMIAAPTAIMISKSFLNRTGLFLFSINVLVFLMCLNFRLERIEGIILVMTMIGYFYVTLKKRHQPSPSTQNQEISISMEAEDILKHHGPQENLGKLFLTFLLGISGVILASKFLIEASINIAKIARVPDIIIGMTILAIGTSLPEFATCWVAGRKGHGELALGNILGANILNILWICGMAAIVYPIELDRKTVYFMFPAMLSMVLITLLLAWHRYELNRWKGWSLIGAYIIYLFLLFYYFPPFSTASFQEVKGAKVTLLVKR